VSPIAFTQVFSRQIYELLTNLFGTRHVSAIVAASRMPYAPRANVFARRVATSPLVVISDWSQNCGEGSASMREKTVQLVKNSQNRRDKRFLYQLSLRPVSIGRGVAVKEWLFACDAVKRKNRIENDRRRVRRCAALIAACSSVPPQSPSHLSLTGR
jgi:hypothetical protein